MKTDKCKVNGRDVALCDALKKALDGSSPTVRGKGLFLPYRVNAATGEKGHDLIQLHSGGYVGRGIVLNFCPFCGEGLKTWEAAK
ncbi:hypothetical protein FCM30_21790 [Lelliottia aquatilis]|uniref:hypothetical protein n=1 Tax=Lelliottia aquatilis TaxID=2080838 RepID=UPI00157593CE|nr:hypothetical protein [Lelliottia aquatilis]NTZ48373.1 hypothetical protein [Lelliottia aquatilis]